MYDTINAIPLPGTQRQLPVVRFIDAIAATLRTWSSRRRQRRALVRLDHRLLDDIGVSFEKALQETRKPFWQP